MQSENFGSMWRCEIVLKPKFRRFVFVWNLSKKDHKVHFRRNHYRVLKHTHLSVIYKIQQSLLFSRLTLIQSSSKPDLPEIVEFAEHLFLFDVAAYMSA